MLAMYIDADGCPVKDEIYRVAKRYQLRVVVVSNRAIFVPEAPLVERVRVAAGPDAADDWIAEHIEKDDVCVTADIPLAARCVERGAQVLSTRGEIFTKDSIGQALAMRDLYSDLRDMGEMTGGPPPMSPRDRSRFAQRLDEVIQRVRRAAKK